MIKILKLISDMMTIIYFLIKIVNLICETIEINKNETMSLKDRKDWEEFESVKYKPVNEEIKEMNKRENLLNGTEIEAIDFINKQLR